MSEYHPLVDMSSSSSSSSSDEEAEDVMASRRTKIYKQRQQYFTQYDDTEFFFRFRLTKFSVIVLLREIAPAITHPTNRGGCIQPMNQLLLTLSFYATGNFLTSVGDLSGISKTSTSRIVRRVSSAIASLRPRYVKMCATNEEMESVSEDFSETARFPQVIGAIDCTLVKMDSVGGADAEIFRSKKGFFALNVQTICDSKLKIRNIVARWPGSCDKQTVFDNSVVKRDFKNGTFGRYLLLGDNGYDLEPYLMRKLDRIHNQAENLYNESLIRTRFDAVEKKNRVWRKRFPVLKLGMRLKLETIMAVIVATAVLHNLAIDMDEYIPKDWMENLEEDYEPESNDVIDGNFAADARNVQQSLITGYFGKL